MMHTNSKAREIRRLLNGLKPFKFYFYGCVVSSISNNCTIRNGQDNIANLLQPEKNKPFYQTGMFLISSKSFLWCLCFYKLWPQKKRKLYKKSAAIAEIGDIFRINLRLV